MKVLLITRPGVGGAARHVHDVVRGLAPRHDLTVLASPREDPAYLDTLARAGATVRPLPLKRGPSPLGDARAWAALARELWKRPYDVIHAHAAKAGALARSVANHTPVVYSPHGFFHHYPSADGWGGDAAAATEQVLARRTGLLALCADWEEREARSGGLVRGDRVAVIRNGVPPTRPLNPERRAAVKAELGIAPEEKLVLMAGRLSPPKTPGLFIQAARRAGPGLRYALAGDGPWLSQLRYSAGPALVLGHRIDVDRLLPAADVAVLSSQFEAAPYFLIEAMAAGRPVVATDLPATREMVGDAGLLVPPGNAAALAEAIDAAASRPELGERGRERAERLHSLTGMLAATEEVWARAIRGRRLSDPAPTILR